MRGRRGGGEKKGVGLEFWQEPGEEQVGTTPQMEKGIE